MTPHHAPPAKVLRKAAPALARLDHLQARVYEMIAEAAAKGERCPSNEVMAHAIHVSDNSAARILHGLVKAGVFTIRRKANFRSVLINATGAKTKGYDNFYERTPYIRKKPVFEPQPIKDLPPRVMRDPCPWCNVRMDAPAEMCCARGRELRWRLS